MDVLTKAEKRLESISSDDLFDRYGKHIADRLRRISPNQIKFVQKLIGDVLFEGEMETLNRNCKVVDMGEKEVYSRPSVPILHTFPPRFQQHQFSHYNVPQTFQYQQLQTEFPRELEHLDTRALHQSTNQLETQSAITNTPPASFQYQQPQTEYPRQLGHLNTGTLQQTTNQLETESAVSNTPSASPASGSALAEYVTIFSGENA